MLVSSSSLFGYLVLVSKIAARVQGSVGARIRANFLLRPVGMVALGVRLSGEDVGRCSVEDGECVKNGTSIT
jgi:hypothetical protein